MRRALAAAAIVALATVGCGGGASTTSTTSTAAGPSPPASSTAPSGPAGHNKGGRRTPTDRAAIGKNAATVIAPGDPQAVCRGLVTERYVRVAYGGVQGCEEALRAQPRSEVRVADVEVQGTRATAVAVPSGGPNEGERIGVRLVKESGDWKVDSVRSKAPVGP
jgi:hypothetical protein